MRQELSCKLPNQYVRILLTGGFHRAERAAKSKTFIRKVRKVPFQTLEEYKRERAAIRRIENLGTEAFALGRQEEAVSLIIPLLERAGHVREFVYKPEAEYDYARICTKIGELFDILTNPEEAIEILDSLLSQYPHNNRF